MNNNETQRPRERREEKRLDEEVEDILQRMDALPTIDGRSENEILGYDDYGIPSTEKNGKLGSKRDVRSDGANVEDQPGSLAALEMTAS